MRAYFQPKPRRSLESQERQLNQLLADVNDSINRKVNDPKLLENFKNAFRKTQPKNLRGGQLKEYQKEALVWMIQLSYKKLNGILADDMGLGKTIQTISYLAYLMEEHQVNGKHLIVCPLTVCNNWQREIKKWLPSLHTEILWGTQEARQVGLSTFVKNRSFDVLIAPFHVIVSCFNQLRKIPWQVLVIDEAHKIKNDEAILSEAVKQYDAKFKLLLTGTPLSNNLRELWSLLNFIMPQLFHDRSLFDEIEDGIKDHSGDENEKFEIQCRMAKKFHGIIRPFIMRRTKKDTDLGLPPKTEHTLYVSMTKLQLKMYKNYLKYKSVYGRGKGFEYSGQIATRKICNHPYLYPEIQAQGADQYGEHLVQNCGKMIVLDKLLRKLINQEKRKILIFSQFKIQLNILEDFCTMRDYNYLRLDGDTGVQEREDMMKQFNEDKNYSIPIFMLSTRAGGLGVNLVAANVVIIYDIDWNPQNDSQAMDRAYRIGQTKPVNVYKMITEHTIEERMLQVQKYKLIWDELVIQKGTIMNIKSQDIFSGLNYQKIANMKKGQIFKIEARKDNNTIDEIIKMGHAKDQKKYDEIKTKVLKQIEEQQKHQNFSANPFEQDQLRDDEGDLLLKKFEGDDLLNAKSKKDNKSIVYNIKSENRAKFAFCSDLNIPDYHLFPEPEKYKDLFWEVAKRNKQIEQLGEIENQSSEDKNKAQKLAKEIEEFEAKIQDMQHNAFTHWQREQFNIFVDQEMKQMNQSADNSKKLHELIPTKSVNEIKKYKKRFYQIDTNKNLPRIFKIRKQIRESQLKNSTLHDRSIFCKFLKDNGAVISKSGRVPDPVGNFLNNMKIESGIEDTKKFLASDYYKNNDYVQILRQVEGDYELQMHEEKLLTTTQLMKKFFKDRHTTVQSALEDPESQNLIKADFNSRKEKWLKETYKKLSSSKNISEQNHKSLTGSVVDDQTAEIQ